MTTIRWFLVLLLAGLLASPVQTSFAQERSTETSPPPVPRWVQTFGKQLKSNLESEDPLIQQQALQHVTYFANFYGEGMDLSDAVPTLVDLYRKDDDANVRLYALVALYSIGDDQGMEQVRRYMYSQDWPPRLQFVTLAALTSHFGAETFSMDREAAVMASRLMKIYTRPSIEVGPLEVVRMDVGGDEEDDPDGQ